MSMLADDIYGRLPGTAARGEARTATNGTNAPAATNGAAPPAPASGVELPDVAGLLGNPTFVLVALIGVAIFLVNISVGFGIRVDT